MRKIVINDEFGGYRLSSGAIERLKAEGITYPEDLERDDPRLVKVVEEMGQSASAYESFKIVEIPEDVEWQIEEYDGAEWVAEKHRTWR
jgi:hypothetical protein